MRCIEIHSWQDNQVLLLKININMRCIEIVIMDGLLDRDVWLTLTWDVLKWGRSGRITCRKHGLTLTWDVLKLVFDRWKINAFQRLTLTWDVLKFISIMKNSVICSD